ncbi:protein kinase [Candidatus Eisenbacteria bacterium]|uniref:Protein kinase n=1 Tax=Eiseniibacteriota bacterium TaxID=2212470 RepID=A0ABV6YIH9_UNCEI
MCSTPNQRLHDREPPVQPGDRLGHYQIGEELGRGGMGIVYRARDLKLGRQVALKCPWPELAAERSWRQRFLREARAASAVSHPNVVQVLEVFEQDGLPWLTLQFIDGRDLQVVLESGGKLPADTVMKYGEQIAEALRAAHAQKVLHRDITPRNIMVTSDGRALLGDFGLARIDIPEGNETAATTDPATATGEGIALGTPRYVSPEQALGRPLDGRSDIFSFGVVLYEMCTGKPAFSASKHGGLQDAIIHREPEPISRFTYDVPEELERIIRKAMSKLPEERYQDIAELLVDLCALRRRTEFRAYSATHSGELQPARLQHRKARFIWIGVAALAALVFLWQVLQRDAGSPLPEVRPFQVTKADASEGRPDFSPDGTRIAYESDKSGDYEVYIVDTHGGNPFQLTNDPGADGSPSWFPDGSALAFASDRGKGSGVWKIGQLGGGATLLLPDAYDPAVSPDGRDIAFARMGLSRNLRIAVAPLADLTHVTILTDDGDGVWHHRQPAWSPDGSSICYASRHGLWIVPATGGDARRLTTQDFDSDPFWSPSGHHVYFSSQRDGTDALWRVKVDGGEIERVTMGSGRENQPCISLDGCRLAYATETVTRSLVIADANSGTETILRALQDAYFPAFAPDAGQVVFASDRAGKTLDLWLQTLNNGEPVGTPRRLTELEGDASHPVFSPDGRWIAYYEILSEQRDIWIVSVAGGQPIRFTDDPSMDIHPAWSPDGTRLAFASDREDGLRIWIAPVSNGQPAGPARRLTDESVAAWAPSWSQDGTMVAFVGAEDHGNQVWVAPAGGDGSARSITQNANVGRVRWRTNTGMILACGLWGEDTFTFRLVSPNDGAQQPDGFSIDFGADSDTAIFDISRNGRFLVFVREEAKGNVWMLEARDGAF